MRKQKRNRTMMPTTTLMMTKSIVMTVEWTGLDTIKVELFHVSLLESLLLLEGDMISIDLKTCFGSLLHLSDDDDIRSSSKNRMGRVRELEQAHASSELQKQRDMWLRAERKLAERDAEQLAGKKRKQPGMFELKKVLSLISCRVVCFVLSLRPSRCGFAS